MHKEREDNIEDEEITIDFGKIKKWFSGKNEAGNNANIEENTKDKETPKESIQNAEKDLDEASEEIDEEIEEEKEKIENLKEAEEELQETEKIIEEEIKEKEERIEKLKEEKTDISQAKEKVHDIEDKTEQEESEVTIDLSKIKSIFKKTVEERTEGIPTEIKEEKGEEDLSIDFSKIKNIFKGSNVKKEKHVEYEKDADTIDIVSNVRAIKDFFVKYRVLFLILIPFLISMHLRLYPAELPITDDWAENSVYNYFKGEMQKQVNSQYPNLPDANKNEIIEANLQEFLKTNKANVEEQIRQTSNYFKSQLKDENDQTYLLAIDPYFWMRHARNIVDHGYPGDKIVEQDGKLVQIDDHMYAPIGRVVPPDMFHAYLQAYTYKFLSIFNKDLDLMKLCFFMPVILASLCVIPAFFIARKFGGNLGGFVAATLVAIHPAFLGRTAGGFSDTDAYNVLFPLFITWALFAAYEAKDLKKTISFSAIAGFLVGLYSFAWGGWWFMFDFMLGASGLYLIYLVVHQRVLLKKSLQKIFLAPETKNLLIGMFIFVLISFVSVSIFQSSTIYFNAIQQPLGFSKIKDVGTISVWPNVFTTVAEQNEVDFNGIISNSGGKFLFAISIFGILLSALILKNKKGLYDTKYAILLIIWLISTIYASTKGVRWILLFVPALSIGIGIATGFVYKKMSDWGIKELGMHKYIARIVVLVLLMFMIFVYPQNMVSASMGTAKGEIPSMNDAWYTALDLININASENAIINSWWDFGHWFKTIGDRPVTFDGTSQNTPMAHWIGKSLMTDDEDTAIGILRMLDCGSNKAFEELDKTIEKPYKTIDILYEIIVEDKATADELLQGYGLSSSQSNDVLQFTHCDNVPEDYYIASEDMIGKSGVWAHFGSWDFKKATMFNKVISMKEAAAIEYLVSEFGKTEEEARSLYFEIKSLGIGRAANDWIAPWPSYSSNIAGCSVQNYTVQCSNGLVYDIKNKEAFLMTQQGKKHPVEIAIATKDSDDGILRIKYDTDTIPYSALLMPSGDTYQSLIMHPDLVASIFTRLFFMEGHGLKHFKPFTAQKSAFGNQIYVYKVDWKGSDMIVMNSITEKIKNAEERFIRHILVNSSEQAEEIRDELIIGGNFSELAQEYSIDAGSAAYGGMIGWIKHGLTVQQFEDAAYELDIGEMSEPIETQYGFHIIQVMDMRNNTEALALT